MAQFKNGDQVKIVDQCDHGDKPCSYPPYHGKLGVIKGDIQFSNGSDEKNAYYNITLVTEGRDTQAYQHEIMFAVPPMSDEEMEAYYIENFIEA